MTSITKLIKFIVIKTTIKEVFSRAALIIPIHTRKESKFSNSIMILKDIIENQN